eukprot:XP_011429981.1 PREDICTED: striated muscle preferentially expressed protein kinase isoform X3 [Crassostrea gigas]
MKKERQFLCFLVVMYPLKISCLLYALLTDYWVETDDFHFGLYKYCVDNTSTCLDVTIQLQTIEDHILVTQYSLIIACILVFVCLVFCVSLCSECSDWLKKKKMHARVNVTGAFFQFLLEACTVFTFVLGVTDHDLLRVSQLSWSFYITSSTMCFTFLFLFVLLHNTLYLKPVFYTKPKDLTVHVGETLNLEAIVKNAEAISWFHEDQILSNSKNKVTLKFVNEKASLKIDCVTKNDEGDYTCLAKSGIDPIKAKEESVYCHVRVIDAELPSFNNVPNSLNVKSGSTLEIAINVCGYPKPKNVCWFKDGKVIERSRSVIIQYMEGVSRLLIHDTVQADSGMYECYAENAHGNNRCKIPVKVTKDDQEPISCTQVLIGVIEG